MRDIILLLWFGVSLPISFFRPFYGIVVFTILAFNRTQDLCWGPARTMRLSYFAATVTVIGFLLNHKGPFFIRDKRLWLMILLFGLVGISVYNAYYPTAAITKFPELGKIVLISIITACVLTTKRRLRALIWATALSLGFYGVKNALLLQSVNRGPGGLLQDNNDFSSALVMTIPMLYFLAIEEAKPWFKRMFAVATPLTCVTVVLTGSRGGFLALAGVLGVLALQSKRRFLAIAFAPLLAAGFLLFTPQQYLDRLASIFESPDASARGRLAAWGTGWRMIQAHPLTGVGYRNFRFVYYRFRSDSNEQPRVAHNSYVQVAAESGIPAFIVFLTMIGYTVLRLRSLRRRVRGSPQSSWIMNYSRAFEVAIYGYMIGAVFLNRAHFDLFYHIVAMSVGLDRLGTIHLDEVRRGEQMCREIEAKPVEIASPPAALPGAGV